MAEVNANSVERLTDTGMQIAMLEIGEPGAICEAAKRCQKGLKTLVEATVENLDEDPSEETIAGALMVAVIVGWKARQALAESEELERLAR